MTWLLLAAASVIAALRDARAAFAAAAAAALALALHLPGAAALAAVVVVGAFLCFEPGAGRMAYAFCGVAAVMLAASATSSAAVLPGLALATASVHAGLRWGRGGFGWTISSAAGDLLTVAGLVDLASRGGFAAWPPGAKLPGAGGPDTTAAILLLASAACHAIAAGLGPPFAGLVVSRAKMMLVGSWALSGGLIPFEPVALAAAAVFAVSGWPATERAEDAGAEASLLALSASGAAAGWSLPQAGLVAAAMSVVYVARLRRRAAWLRGLVVCSAGLWIFAAALGRPGAAGIWVAAAVVCGCALRLSPPRARGFILPEISSRWLVRFAVLAPGVAAVALWIAGMTRGFL